MTCRACSGSSIEYLTVRVTLYKSSFSVERRGKVLPKRQFANLYKFLWNTVFRHSNVKVVPSTAIHRRFKIDGKVLFIDSFLTAFFHIFHLVNIWLVVKLPSLKTSI